MNFAKETTLFVQTGNQTLLQHLQNWAVMNNLNIYQGRTGTSDILAVPFCIAVVDSREVGSEIWRQYVEYRNETADVIPCILVDAVEADPFDEYNREQNIDWFDMRQPTWQKQLTFWLDLALTYMRETPCHGALIPGE